MRRRTYPLDPLATVRARKVEGAVAGLATAITQREKAEGERRSAEDRKAAQEAKAARIVQAERESLEQGQLRAADLARAHAWQLRSEAEHAALASQVERASAAEAEARSAEGAARTQVAGRKADAEVVENDRERWTAEGRKRDEAKEEEAMAEAFRPRPGR
jgi:hypothetical protein